MDKAGLLAAAAVAAGSAHSPYSGFKVGAAIETADGRVLTGCNIENASYGLTNCAERTALFTGIADGIREFTAVAVVVSGSKKFYPCGACRQVLSEFCGPETPVHIATIENLDDADTVTLGELLPHSFSLKDEG